MKDSAKINNDRLVAVAYLAKRHTFKENKWKAVAVSGLAGPWLEKIGNIYLKDQSIPIKVKIDVPLNYTSEFFVSFPEGFEASQSEIFVERKFFPEISGNEFYVCDLLGAILQSSLGEFKLVSFFENGDPIGGISSMSLFLESTLPIKGKITKVEVPVGVLRRKESSWYVEDIELWLGAADSTPPDEKN